MAKSLENSLLVRNIMILTSMVLPLLDVPGYF
ncbi:Uncharacterized protein XB15_02999 [Leptospira santarosai]|nr:Uncharacterized protein XB15_02999 [Leptospira santarosai]